MIKIRLLLPLILGLSGSSWCQAEPVAEVPAIVITANDTMRFSVTQIDAKPGQTMHIQLRNTGTVPIANMGHNWVLLQKGENVDAYANAAMMEREHNYLPPALSSTVIASIKMLGPKQSADVTFTAPTVPGKYPYLCSFPGHAGAGMKGFLIVK